MAFGGRAIPRSSPSPAGSVDPNPGERVARTTLTREFELTATPETWPAARCLGDAGIAPAAIAAAAREAACWGVPLHTALIAGGHVDEDEYCRRLADALAVPVAGWAFKLQSPPPFEAADTFRCVGPAGEIVVLAADAAEPHRMSERVLLASLTQGRPVYLATRRATAAALERHLRPLGARRAVFGLARRHPDWSAARPLAAWQGAALAIWVGLAIGLAIVAPGPTLAAILVVLTLAFLAVVLVRLVALGEAVRPRVPQRRPPLLTDAQLPTYTVLVPVFDEGPILPKLVAGLAALDYPAAKLDIVLVLEEVDLATKAALIELSLPAHMRAIVVPDGLPRTKPKALNYALQFASGTYVVVFDAEDRPEPDQLRRAVAAFSAGGPRLACVQAQLNIYNARDTWFTRQFTVEYTALFDAILPALDRLGLPLPLGGTSNHFPRAILDAAGGWDPFNVTEDADLGIRLARLGYRTEVLASTTWEEAPQHFGAWFRQRSRWLKGWMQTYLVHTRRPLRLWRELGTWKWFGLHVCLGGLILSALAHPLVYMLFAWHHLAAPELQLPDLLGPALWAVALATLAASYGSAIVIGVLTARRRGHRLGLAALQMPLCWLLVSLAAYRALWQLWRNPFHWEKTAHGQTRAGLSRATSERSWRGRS